MTAPRSVPHLLARAHGLDCAGPLACFYCGAPCDETCPASEYVKDSFTGRQGVRAPGSPAVCAGCVLCLREDAEVSLIDGTRRRVAKGCMRAWSWLVTADRALAASKAHLDRLRTACLEPPPAPWALVLSDSGQTHQLYRGVVNHGGPPWVVTLEAEPIAYRPAELRNRLDLCGRLIAATGKPALAEPIAARFALAVLNRYPAAGEALLADWARLRGSPAARLAAWLAPNKEICLHEYPGESESIAVA